MYDDSVGDKQTLWTLELLFQMKSPPKVSRPKDTVKSTQNYGVLLGTDQNVNMTSVAGIPPSSF